jgi:2-C-methyl-D-erythritol 4-phosphate cytidylyltransferase
MVEAIGHRVKLVDCGPENFKITTKADLIMAEVLLRMQEREEKKPKKKEKAGASK